MCGETELVFFFTLCSHLKFSTSRRKTRNKARAGEKQKTGNEERKAESRQKVPNGMFACYKQTHSGVLGLSKHERTKGFSIRKTLPISAERN